MRITLANPGQHGHSCSASLRQVASTDVVVDTNDETLRDCRQTGRFKKVCVTDPDVTMTKNGRNRRLEPACKQHIAVDGVAGAVADGAITTGEKRENPLAQGTVTHVAQIN